MVDHLKENVQLYRLEFKLYFDREELFFHKMFFNTDISVYNESTLTKFRPHVGNICIEGTSTLKTQGSQKWCQK